MAFLQEMGVGVQWKLRNGETEGDAFVAAVQALADGWPEEDAPSAVAPTAVMQTVAAPAPQVVPQVVAAPAPAPHVAAPAAMPPAPPVGAPAVARAAPSMPPSASPESHAGAPAGARTAPPVQPPAASAATSEDDSMAWFDDAPVPPVAPRSAPPAKPAARAAAPVEAEPAGEDTAWFDDAPMPPPSATPSRSAANVAADASLSEAAPSRFGNAVSTAAASLSDLAAASRAVPELASVPVSDEAIAGMDWPTLQAAVSSCTRCPLCETRIAAVNGRGAERATWIAIAAAPSVADEQDVQAITGEAGQLLHNMLKAIELKPEADVYITNVVKCCPPERNPTGDEVIACRPYLERELALTGATMAMTFGQFAAKGLMMGPAARGKVMHYGANQLPVVATYHPDDLLRKPEDKAKAWADLCLAKVSHG
jgi:DNA polymerase